ncbi:MAG TPA: aldolase/citrate lyase family protein [Spirochaetales bacterium]|nr:aldolase/citrate lyase family protein [Spirochaetales bacterium]HRY56352.1 aldolase/citrate lyase family protein [Spirochaetia bacterium]HRZ65480.1 aldolase/citrate lyase family protein [Spirochaetia bacterium]
MKALEERRLVVGGHVFLTDPSISEAMASFGYDFIWIDAEHGPFDKEKLLAHVVAANGAGAAAIVRVASNDAAVIKPVLEMGVDGIIVPMVCSRLEAERAVAACRYPPEGIRGFGPRRANRYGMIPLDEYLRGAEASLLRIVQIEHVDAVRDLEGILEVEGLSAVIIGPNDLSASIGKLGQLRHPEVAALCERIVRLCKLRGKPCGVSVGPGDRDWISYWLELGVDFISCGDDISFLAEGAARTIGFIREGAR